METLKSINMFTQVKEIKTPETERYGLIFTGVYTVCMLVIVIVLTAVTATQKAAIQVTVTNPSAADYTAAQQYNPLCPCTNTIFPYSNVIDLQYYNGVCAQDWDTFCSFTNVTGNSAAQDMMVDSLVTPNVIEPNTLTGLINARYSTAEDQFTSTIRAACGIGISLVFTQAKYTFNGYINYSQIIPPYLCDDSLVFGTYIAGWQYVLSPNAATQFDNYFAACAPTTCTYTKSEVPSASAVVIYVFGLVGGAHAALTGICGAIVGFLVKDSVEKAQKGAAAASTPGSSGAER